ncbi:MAG: PD-(D/E)XK nuclease family protein [Candidatus Omnitrophota bacterium]
MDRIITYNFNDDFIDRLGSFIVDNYAQNTQDLSRIAIVFGGRRPALFLKRNLAKKIKKSFIPPKFFSIDDFMNYLVCSGKKVTRIPDLEACYSIYRIAKTNIPEILKSREDFSDFLPWAREISSFIDQLDIENIDQDRLISIERNAQIGYEVPDNINALLENLMRLRELYHQNLIEDNKYARGFLYLRASEIVADQSLEEFDKILFCNFFDLHLTEKKVIKNYYDSSKAILFFQKDQSKWQQFEELAEFLKADIISAQSPDSGPEINLYAGFDNHSEVGIVRQILKEIKNKNSTVVVLPQADTLLPLLSEITSSVDDYNVSMGYPVRRSSLYSLFSAINRAQKTRNKQGYYAKDYLAVLMHPLLKNLAFFKDGTPTRMMVHKIEEMLSGLAESTLSGSLFLDIELIENQEELYTLNLEQLQPMGFDLKTDDLKDFLSKLHHYAFCMWEEIGSLGEFADKLSDFLDMLVEKSVLSNYPLNIKIIKKIYSIAEEFKAPAIVKERFGTLEIFKIFDDFLKTEKIAFSGTPLKGLQVLGLFETRALSFENVIILDVNESILPRLSANEPLVPRPIMVSLGIDRLEEEEGIQRYQFMRLISGAKNVHLVYNDSPDKEKSRFIEEIIWQKEKEAKSMGVVSVPRAAFNVEVLQKQGEIAKDNNVEEFLKDITFSASSVNTYLNCPMQFYYRYVLGLSEKEDMLDELESREVGTFTHDLLEDTFKPFMKNTPVINDAFRKRFFKEFDKRFAAEFSRRMKSDAFMIEQILRHRLERFLDNEADPKVRPVASIEGLEQEIVKNIDLGSRTVSFKCRIDRIDRIDSENLLVLDYKTGSSDITPRGLATLEKAMEAPDRQIIKKSIRSFQLPLYLHCVQEQYPGQIVSAALYNLRTLDMNYFPKPKEYEHKDEIMQLCLGLLSFIIEEIHDMNMPFVSDESEESCRYCPFVSLCR